MHAPFLFVVIPAVLLFMASITSSAASPSVLIHKKHHTQHKDRSRTSIVVHPTKSTRRTRVKHIMSPRSLDLADVYLNGLTSDHDGIISASSAFSHTAQRARSQNVHDSAYQREAATGLTAYRNSLDPLHGLLAQLAADKGRVNYDKYNQYETLLKGIVDASKRTFSDVDNIINADPLLGPVLGPIMYEIKCILDEILDATENITDATFNQLAPLLRPLILSATKTVCHSILPPVAGLCLTL